MIQLTRTTITTLIQYGIGVKNMTKDKNKIIDQLWSLQKLLEEVQELVEGEESRGSSRLSALGERLDAPNGLPRCRDELETLNSLLEAKDGRIDHAVQALKWPLKQGEVKQRLDYLKEFQQLLGSTLHVDNMCVAPAELQTDPDSPHRRLVLEIHTGACHIPMAARNIAVSDVL